MTAQHAAIRELGGKARATPSTNVRRFGSGIAVGRRRSLTPRWECRQNSITHTFVTAAQMAVYRGPGCQNALKCELNLSVEQAESYRDTNFR